MRTLKKRYIVLVFAILCTISMIYYRTPSVIEMGGAKIINGIVDGENVKIIRIEVKKDDIDDIYREEMSLLYKKCNSNNIKLHITAVTYENKKPYIDFELPKDFDFKILDSCLYIETTQTMFGSYMMSEPIKLKR
jgi:hypothetical protein